MDEWEREWIVVGMAWVGLRHWRCGRAEGEAARTWLLTRLDARRAGRHITPDLERLEAELFARLNPWLCADADMPEFAPVA